MEDRKTEPRWTPGVRRDNDPRAIVEQKLRHLMFDKGWGAWTEKYLIAGARCVLFLNPEPFKAFNQTTLKSMVRSMLHEVAGIEGARCSLTKEALIISIPTLEKEKLYDVIDENGPGRQANNVVTLNVTRRA